MHDLRALDTGSNAAQRRMWWDDAFVDKRRNSTSMVASVSDKVSQVCSVHSKNLCWDASPDDCTVWFDGGMYEGTGAANGHWCGKRHGRGNLWVSEAGRLRACYLGEWHKVIPNVRAQARCSCQSLETCLALAATWPSNVLGLQCGFLLTHILHVLAQAV